MGRRRPAAGLAGGQCGHVRRGALADLAVAALVAVAAVPAALGWQAERTYTRVVERINADHRDLDVRIDAYDRGWLSSRARYTVRLGGRYREALRGIAGADRPLELHGRDRIRHGVWAGGRPAAARIDSAVHTARAPRDPGRDAGAHAPVLGATSVIGLTGDVRTRFRVPDRRIEAGARAPGGGGGRLVVEWHDVSGDAGLADGVGRFTLRVREAVLHDDRGDRLAIAGLELRQRSRRGAGGVRLQDARVAVRRLDLRVEGGARPLAFRLERLTLRNRVDAEGDAHVGIVSELAFERARVDGVALTDGRLETRLRHLRPRPLARLQALMAGMRRGHGAGGGPRPGGPPDAAIDAALAELLRGSPRLEADRLRLRTPDGRIAGDLRLAFDGERRFDLDAPLTLLGPLSVRLELQAPRALVRRGLYRGLRGQLPRGEFRAEMEARLRRQVERSVDLLVGSGLLAEQRDRLVLRIDKDAGGPALVNGRDVTAVIGAVAGLVRQ